MSTNSTLELSSQALPKDLVITSQPDSVDKDKFKVVASGLKVDKSYAFQFQYVFADGTTSEWSPGYFLSGTTESVPSAPVTTITGGAGFIKVELPIFPANASRVDIRVAGGTFGSGAVVTDSFTSAGTKTITAAGSASPGLAYVVTLLTVTPSKVNGDPSSPVTVYVTDPTANLQVEPPTLASGLTVNSAPFAVSVNWAGTYSSSDFDGFKSIDIHVRSSDVGSTSTSGFSTTTQVATLTVTGTTNRQNIGLDNLRQALGLADNTAAYTAPMFFYYITRNSQDALYSVSGTPTYTRINSTTVNPAQANFVDLANGVISIEKLVAGNGNFSSYLRIGSKETSGGARIELSGVDNFTDALTTRTVQRGLTAYDSGNNEVLRFDYGATTPTLTIKGNGEFSGSLAIGNSTNGQIFKAQPSTGIWLGANAYLDAPFKVNTTGYLESTSGKIGGWSITSTILESATVSNNKITLNPATPKISLISGGVEKITIDPIEGIKDSGGNFILSPAGSLTLKGSFSLTGYETYNNWSGTQFIAGTANSYLSVGSTTGTTIIKSSDTTQDSTDGNTTTIPVPQQIVVNSSSISIQGLPGITLGSNKENYSLTGWGDLLGPDGDGISDPAMTQYWSAGYTFSGREPSANYGAPARYRTIIADPFDYNKLKRGFAVYYGVRSTGSAPPASTGHVGDLWVSW
jgi:hypothetical protein